MIVNIIESYRNVITICDKELIGKYFSEENKQLDVKESFYSGENSKEMQKEEVSNIIKEWIKEDATFNIVGEKSIQTALESNIISEKSIGTIQDIPYAMVLL